jgi:hypothetical protein
VDRIGSHVERELGRFDGRGAMPRIVGVWVAAVGAEVARNAWPGRIMRDGTLLVHTSSSVWAFELGQLAPTILARLEELLGEHAPGVLRFAQGHLPEPPAPVPARAPQPISASDEARAEARLLASSIDDPELRERVVKAAALGLERAASDHSF